MEYIEKGKLLYGRVPTLEEVERIKEFEKKIKEDTRKWKQN